MRGGAVVVAAATIGLVGGCVDSELDIGARSRPIVDGVVDPYDHGVVSLAIGNNSFCTGTLVSPRVVVTAAHCIDGFPNVTDLRIHAGVRVGDADIVRVQDGVIHPDYQGGPNDIALLQLELPARARPWPLHRAALAQEHLGRDVRIAGYGTTDPDGGTDGVKREGVGAISDFDGFDFAYVNNPSQTCFGDSGGPVFLTLADGVETLAGITSRGDEACAVFSINTRIDVYQEFIDAFVATRDPTVADCGEDGACAVGCDAPDPDCPCELDGFCTTACERYNIDRDCPPGCEHDGACQASELCPEVDADCNPIAVTGDRCLFDTDCVDGECVAAIDDPRLTYCSDACASDDDCPGDMTCTDNPSGDDLRKMCRHPSPSPGAQGFACDAADECFDGRCIDGICAASCTVSSTCAKGFSCQKVPEEVSACLPASEAGCLGCGASGAGGGRFAPLVLAGLGLLLAARRRR